MAVSRKGYTLVEELSPPRDESPPAAATCDEFTPTRIWTSLIDTLSNTRAGVLCAVFLTAVVSASAAWQIATLTSTPSHFMTDSSVTGSIAFTQTLEAAPCGSTPEQALAKGCLWDPISTGWLPSRCIDWELADEFNALYAWEFFDEVEHADGERELVPLPANYTDAASRSPPGHGLLTSVRWHRMHCLYALKKVQRALLNGWLTDGFTLSPHHTEHCFMSLGGQYPGSWDALDAHMFVQYPSC